MHAVGPDQRGAFKHATVLVRHANALFANVDVADACGGVHFDVFLRLHFFVNRQVNVGAVNDRVRVVEAIAKLFPYGNKADNALVHRVHHDEVVGVNSPRPRARPAAQRIHRGEGVGAKLDARANLANLGRLFEDGDVKPGLVEAQRAGHAANAAAHHDDSIVPCCAHPVSLPPARHCGRGYIVSIRFVCILSISRPAPPPLSPAGAPSRA